MQPISVLHENHLFNAFWKKVLKLCYSDYYTVNAQKAQPQAVFGVIISSSNQCKQIIYTCFTCF